ncbi:GNAT family N-acetyltransferase [Flavobacterium cerinum]|uniref:GNAT family N-acetyltransferase n=1 Tax=Flavobacterium cerinum TaxID=2502784 RepID=A0A444GRY3_9FLAO|nr:GNAT family N-acetyltransferase [Flavobacterium cerinum]RWW93767.1 GNAT family N-acetyltransferase [Flavobacterium cerinum]
MLIRKGQKEDMPAVLDLIKELATFEKEPNAVAITVDELIKEGFGDMPLFHTFVAEVDGEIIGTALFYYRFSTWKGKTIHLEDLIVKQEKRGTGAGSALYKEVIRFAKQDGVRRVEWVVLNWNTHAINFYERSGATILQDWLTVQMDEEGITKFTLDLVTE